MAKKFLVLCLLAACSSSGGGGGGLGGDDGIDTCSETSDSCGGETICVSGSCVAAFGRVYSIRDVSVQVPTTDPNGAAWDAGGGAPDLKLEVLVNGTSVAMTPAVQDQFSATFAGPFNVTLIAGSSLELSVLDEDLTVDDPAYGCGASPIEAGQLRQRALMCASAGGTLSFEIDPR